MLENHMVKTIPRIGCLRTETVKAYAETRGHPRDLKKAFVELYEIRYDEKALPTDVKKCEADATAYLEGRAGIPAYTLKALELVRLWQVQVRTRV